MTDHNLDDVTIDSVQWATGHVRPRMALEEKRTKHRGYQRDCMMRQRQHIEHLQCDVGRYTLQLQLLEITQEAVALLTENKAMKQQLHGSESKLIREQAKIPFEVDCEDSPIDASPLMVEDDEQAVLLELLDMVPDVQFFQVDSPSDVDAFSWCPNVQVEPLAWPSSPLCATDCLELVLD